MKEKTKKISKEIFSATGRRKEAVARVKLLPKGTGRIMVNGKDFTDYFATIDNIMQVKKPLETIELDQKFDVTAKVSGGGKSGQAGALSLGISRCLLAFDPELRPILRRTDLLTRDPRAKERKKYGRKGARKRFQWTKR